MNKKILSSPRKRGSNEVGNKIPAFAGKALFAVVFAMTILGGHAAFAKACYSPPQAEAEQGIRIHSELMVIGLNCQHMTPKGWRNFYAQYREFTNEHADLLAAYEETLIAKFTEEGKDDPERALHDLRTSFANEISTDAAAMRPDIFCATYAPRIPKAAEMSRRQVERWASTAYASHPVSRPICEH